MSRTSASQPDLPPSGDSSHPLVATPTPEAPSLPRRRTWRAPASLYRALVEQDPDALVVTDADGRIQLVNAQTEALFGYTRSELLGQPVEQLLPERDHVAQQQQRRTYAAAPRSCPSDASLLVSGRRRDGSEFPVEIAIRPLLSEKAGGAALIISTIRDLSGGQRAPAAWDMVETARADREAVWAESERQAAELHLLFAGMSDSVLLYDAAGTLVWTNPAARQLLGLDAAPPGYARLPLRERLASYQMRDAHGRPFGPEESPIARALRGEALTGAQAMDIRLRNLEGRELDLHISGGLLRDRAGRLVGAIGILHDQTARKHMEQALRESEARYRDLVEAQTDLICRFRPDGTLTFVNAAYCQHYGRPAEELIGRRVVDLIDPPRRDGFLAYLAALVAQPHTAVDDYAFVRPDGSTGWLQWIDHPITDAAGQVVEVQAVGRDITERKQLEQEREAVRAQAERQAEELDRIVEAMADAVIVYDAQGRTIRTNAAAHQLLGLHAAPPGYYELQAGERVGLYHKRDAQGRPLVPHDSPSSRALRGEVLTGSNALDIRLRTLDGRDVEVNSSAAPLRDQDGHIIGAVGIMRDQTERNHLERAVGEQARQLQATFAAITDAIILYDRDGTIQLFNPAAHALLLAPLPTEYVTRPLQERVASVVLCDAAGIPLPAKQHPIMRLLRGEVLSGAHTQEVLLRLPDGREIAASVGGAPIWDNEGTIIGAVKVVRDETARKHLEREREEAREAAAQQAVQLDRLFEQMADGVTIFDAKGHIVRENTAQRRILGLEGAPPDYYDREVNDYTALFHVRDERGTLIALEDAPSARALRGEALTGAHALDLRVRTLDGREADVTVSAAPLLDHDGRIVGAMRVLRDETERKRLEREREAVRAQAERQAEELDRLFEALGDGVVVYDANERVVRANAMIRHLLETEAVPPDARDGDVSTMSPNYAIRVPDGRRLAPSEIPVRRVLRGERLTGPDVLDIVVHTPDGRDVELSVSGVPLHDRDGRLVGAACVYHDQTEQNRLRREGEQARANELAAREVAQQLDRFFTIASHDIRSPATAAGGFVQLAQARAQLLAGRLQDHDEHDSRLLSGLLSTLERADQSYKRLQRLVTQLFDTAQAGAGKLTLSQEHCDLGPLVEAQVAAQQVAVPSRQIDLELPSEPVWVEVDADRLGQVLTNYLTNALKYSPNDAPVTVRVGVTAGKAGVAVQDQGPGLSPEERARVWELYHRVPGITVQSSLGANSGSLGVGLYVCKHLIELHPGGQVGVDSVVGGGSTFWFTLPLAE